MTVDRLFSMWASVFLRQAVAWTLVVRILQVLRFTEINLCSSGFSVIFDVLNKSDYINKKKQSMVSGV